MARNSGRDAHLEKRREGERKETGKYTSVVDLAAPEPINSTLKIQQEKSARSCCHSSRIQADMENTG